MVPNNMRTLAPLFWSARAAQNSTGSGEKTGKGVTVSALLIMCTIKVS